MNIMAITRQTIVDRNALGSAESIQTHDNKEHSEFYKQVIACIRALSNDTTLTVSVGDDAQAEQSDVNLPLIDNESNQSLMVLIRGLGDSFAMMRRHHDPQLHNRMAPSDPIADRLFTVLERERFESVGAGQFIGVARNLDSVWALSHSADALARFGPAEQLEFVLCCLFREQLSNRSLSKVATQFIEPIRGPIEDLLEDSFTKLAQSAEHQHTFSEQTLAIIERLGFDIARRHPTPTSEEIAQDDIGNEPEQGAQNRQDSSDDESSEEPTSDSETVPEVNDDAELSEQAALTRNSETSSDNEEELENLDENAIVETTALTPTGLSEELNVSPYRVFDNADDEIRKAASLIDAPKLRALRKELDIHVQRYEPLIGQLATRMQQVLLSRQNTAWQQDLDEGELNPQRLTRIISNPHSSLAYRIQSEYPVRDTAVSLLIDNSRSMLGKPITTAACCADLITRVLDRCGVSTEVLGFTTVTMYGGAVADRWQAQKCPADVGRLNNVRHVIYKSAVDSWQRSRDNFGLMLDKTLLKQNIDGEALLWAQQRLLKRPERRRIMMVISDGKPSDSFTQKANHKHYLRDHLDHVVAQIELRSSIELIAVGIGHQVSHHYRRSFYLDDVEQLGPLLLREISRSLRV